MSIVAASTSSPLRRPRPPRTPLTTHHISRSTCAGSPIQGGSLTRRIRRNRHPMRVYAPLLAASAAAALPGLASGLLGACFAGLFGWGGAPEAPPAPAATCCTPPPACSMLPSTFASRALSRISRPWRWAARIWSTTCFCCSTDIASVCSWGEGGKRGGRGEGRGARGSGFGGGGDGVEGEGARELRSRQVGRVVEGSGRETSESLLE